MRATAGSRRLLAVRRLLAEFWRLEELGVDDAAATVLAEGLAARWSLRGDTSAAYNRHRRYASPLARERHAVWHRRQRAAARRAVAA